MNQWVAFLCGAVVASLLLPTAFGADLAESFESDLHPSVTAVQCKAERVKQHASDGEWALKVSFRGSEQDTWPGLNVDLSEQNVEKRMVFAFDVFNPHDEPVGLSYRIDAPGGANKFGGETLKAGASTTVEIWVSALLGEQGAAGITRVFPYIRMPRKDYVLFFDHVRLEELQQRFKRIAYVEIAQPSDADASSPRVFRRGELGHAFPNSVPWPGEQVDQLALFATPGETEPLALSFHIQAPTKQASLSLSEFVCVASKSAGAPGSVGVPLPPEIVEVGCVRHLDKKVTYSSSDYVADIPTYVEPGNTFGALPANTTRTFWLRFRVPSGAAPGLYRGLAMLRLDDASREIPIALTVLPFILPEPKGYFIGEYFRPWGYGTDEAWKAGVSADLADMRDHGMTSVGVCIGFDIERVTYTDGDVDLGLDGTTRFEHFLDTYVTLGFHAPIVMLSDSGQAAARKVAQYGTPEFDAAYKAFWQAVQAACKERGWPELIVQPVDEPSWQSKEHRDRNLHLLKLLKEIPGMRTEQDGPGDNYFRNEAGPYADMWNYNGGIDAFDQVREIRKNHLVAFYNNDVESYRPEVDRYVAGFFLKAADIDGVFNWEYRGGPGSLYDDFDGKTGDWVHNYPPSDSSQGGPSVAWEMEREGVDDLRHLILFDEWLGKARTKDAATQAVKQAEALRAYVFESLQPSTRVRGRAQWSHAWSREQAQQFADDFDPEADKFVAGALKQPNGWSLQDYQRARWAIALSTLELMAVCGESVLVPFAAPVGKPVVSLIGHTPYPEQIRSGGEEGASKTITTIPRLPEAPTLDGNLDDAAWNQAFRIERFVSNQGDDIEVQTSAVLGWFGDDLYIGVRCSEPAVQNLLISCMEDGEPCYIDDCVELFFDPEGARTRFAQLVFSSRPVQWSQDVRGIPWKQRVPVQTAVGENEWRLEAAIPLSEVSKGGGRFGFNIGRERRAGGELELSCWQPTGGQFGTPSAFAHLKLEGFESADGAAIAEDNALDLRAADAFLYSSDLLNVETEWTGDPALLDTSTLRYRLLSGQHVIGEAVLPAPLSARVNTAILVSHIPPGQYETEVAVIDQAGTVLASAKKRCRVVAACHP